jgi:hypothetical protein
VEANGHPVAKMTSNSHLTSFLGFRATLSWRDPHFLANGTARPPRPPLRSQTSPQQVRGPAPGSARSKSNGILKCATLLTCVCWVGCLNLSCRDARQWKNEGGGSS